MGLSRELCTIAQTVDRMLLPADDWFYLIYRIAEEKTHGIKFSLLEFLYFFLM